VPLGATTEGSTFSYSTNVEAITVAEFFDPIKYATTERSGNIAFNLVDFTLQRYRMALNGGVGALTRPPRARARRRCTTTSPWTPATRSAS
jgi:hypothetical protein